jgi:copper chaperone
MAEQITVPVQGMSCGHCVARVEKALQGVAGVADVSVSLEAAEATITYDPALAGLDDFRAAVTEAGYDIP